MTVVELNGSGTLECNAERWRGQRIYHVTPFAGAEAFCASLLGSERPGGNGQVVRTPPAAFASGSRLYAVGCRVEGLGRPTLDAEGLISYEGGARVEVEFATLPFDADEIDPDDPQAGTYLTEEVRVSGELISLPKTRLEWASDNAPLSGDDVSPGRLVPKAEWVVTRHRVPVLPRSAIFQALGYVNSATIGDAAAETLLFIGATARRELGGESDRSWKVTYTFLYDPETHNRFYRGHAGGWDGIVTRDGGDTVYPSTDLKSLLPELL